MSLPEKQVVKKRTSSKTIIIAGLGSFFVTALLAWFSTVISEYRVLSFLMIGSFGASITIISALPHSESAKVKNIIGGSTVSALIGVVIAQWFSEIPWFSGALAVSLSIIAMQLMHLMHPPGGATALIATMGGADIFQLGYSYIFSPVLLGMLVIGLFSVVFRCLHKSAEGGT